MKLALRLGMTLSQLENTMTARELYLWAAFDSISPIGDERQDIHSAQIASAVYQSQGAKVSLQDLLLKWESSEESETEDTSGEDALSKALMAMAG